VGKSETTYRRINNAMANRKGTTTKTKTNNG
jgi:hypothetical protein